MAITRLALASRDAGELLASLFRGARLALALLLRALCPWPYLYVAERRLLEVRRVHVMIAEKRNVLLDASLAELAAWGAMLTSDEAGRGRRIAVVGKATVAIRRLS